uniref:NADH dehydrogenase subunit 4L n=1 Tax=Thaparocleidus varicus TaxID=341076 RepID=A0A7L8ZRD9_9PLAT|nr:NADH dehydrogenase subunit 4L [Thaparocleidus varicus]QOI72762.1 NADH dehydrogenase subunit 4L [Thaparocleidus varicus]
MLNLYFYVSLIVLFGVFCLVSFKFISVLILLENINILILVYIFLNSFNTINPLFLIFMVIVTIEVTLSLVSLTRVWDCDSLVY